MKGKPNLGGVVEWSGVPDLVRLILRLLPAAGLFLRGSLYTAAAFLVAFSPQDPPQDPDAMIMESSHAVSGKSKDGKRNLTMLSGLVRIKSVDIDMKADRVLLWHSKEGAEEFDELYAEGEVRYKFPEGQLRADKLFYDRKTSRFALRNMRLQTRDKKTGQDRFITAEEAWESEKGTFQLRRATLSTCGYEDDHAGVDIAEATMKGLLPRPGASDFAIFPYDTWQLEAYENVPTIVGVPVGYLPYFSYTKGEEPILRELKVGRSTRFGVFVESALGIDITHEEFDTINPAGPSAPHLLPERWGEVLLELDYRTERGFATGLDVNFESDDYAGFLDTYWLVNDAGPNPDVPFDRRFGSEGNRGRVKFFNRWDVDPNWRTELETSWLSDRDLLEEFFEKEFKRGKEQENTAYVRWLDENMGGFAQYRLRVNEFQSQLEYLPRARFVWTGQPLDLSIPGWFEDLTMSLSSEVGNLRTRRDDLLNLPEDRTWRWDSQGLFSLPTTISDVNLLPFAGGRVSFYEKNLDGDADARGVLTAGIHAKTQLHRVYALSYPELNFHGLRHIMKYGAGGASNLVASGGRTDFFPHDAVDAVHEFSEFFVEMEHRLETKVRNPLTGEEIFTFLRAAMALEMYPDGRRDTTFLNANSFQSPFYWLFVSPDADGTFRKRSTSNAHWSLELTPRDWISFSLAGEFDPSLLQEEFRYGAIRVFPFGRATEVPDLAPGLQPKDLLSIDLSNSYARGITNSYGLGIRFSPTEKWTLDARTNYDTKTAEFLRHSLTLERDYHDLVVRLAYLFDVTRDDHIIAFEVSPKALGSMLQSSDPFSHPGAGMNFNLSGQGTRK